MTDTPADSSTSPSRRKPGFEGMLLPELKQIASGLGLRTTGMRKGQIVEAIKASQTGGQTVGQTGSRAGAKPDAPSGTPDAPEASEPAPRRRRRAVSEQAAEPQPEQPEQKQREDKQQPEQKQPEQKQPEPKQREDKQPEPKQREDKQPEPKQREDKQQSEPKRREDKQQGDQQQGERRPDRQQDRQQDRSQDGQQDGQDDEQGGSRRNRRRRGRDRGTTAGQGDRPQQGGGQGGGNQGNQSGGQERHQGRGSREPDLQILEDDVLTPCAGILDLMDNYAFVRTSGYLPGVDDVYVSMSMVRKHGLRRGDAVVGQVRQPREGERKEKFNPLVRIDSVNGGDPDAARTRVEFTKLTPLNPTERLRMETGPGDLVGRLADLATPLGKGQRAIVLSPPRAGKTTVLQTMARSVTANHPECHLMVVLVDERPEEVTDFQRSIKGEVIGSTFDRVPGDHTLVAELALERAMRLVELGHDVVVLLDGLTRLARAYNLAATHSSRSLPSGLDINALHPPKRLFGSARNVENGGSLTIVATVSVETGSAIDEAILEEFRSTANAELWLDGELAQRRLHPTVDLVRSSTRREDLLLGEQESGLVAQLRRGLAGEDAAAAHGRLMELVQGSGTNLELLRRVQASGSGTAR